jgi:hypothetical protein
MVKERMYRYIGKNGIITSYVLLDGISHILMYRLKADDGKILSNGAKKVYSIIIPPEELEDWKEIPDEINK